VTFIVRLVCTDRGQHTRRPAGRAKMLSDGWVLVSGSAVAGGQGGAGRCARCGRNLQLSPERWTAVMRGIAEVDISALPF
jgi:hypothetical protein